MTRDDLRGQLCDEHEHCRVVRGTTAFRVLWYILNDRSSLPSATARICRDMTCSTHVNLLAATDLARRTRIRSACLGAVRLQLHVYQSSLRGSRQSSAD